jgi:hypothetical protein
MDPKSHFYGSFMTSLSYEEVEQHVRGRWKHFTSFDALAAKGGRGENEKYAFSRVLGNFFEIREIRNAAI